ncbi:MAG: hypothetical protein H7Y09_04740, partial [Chitinophagaceae bacterium]|nr:hypothetical protein [Anaerolineae bacterium]
STHRALLIAILVLIGITTLSAQSETPLPLYALPVGEVARVSSTLALTEDGRTLIAANSYNDTVSLIAPNQSQVIAEVAVGDDPRSVAISSDGTRALIVNRSSGTLSIIDLATQTITTTYPVGSLPTSLVTADDATAYISLQGTNEVIHIEENTGKILNRISTPAMPTGLALWGDFLYVTHFWSGDLSLIYLPQMQVVRTIQTGQDTSLSQSIAIDPVNGIAYIPQSRSNTQNETPTYDSTIFPVVNVVNLRDLSLQRERRLSLETVDRPVNMPFAAALDVRGTTLFVVNAGSNDISVIDLTTGLARAHLPLGSNPRGIIVSSDGGTAYIHNVIDGTITFLDARNLVVDDALPISSGTNIPADVLIGAELFHSADDSRLSANGWISCASCHFDGMSDGRVWQGWNTPVLYDLGETAPYNWTGNWDELADVELKIRALQAGTGLLEGLTNPPAGDPHAGLSPDLDTLTAYLLTLQGAPTPFQADPALLERGAAVFEENSCGSCHAGSALIDGQRHDVGTDGEFDTPTLRWLWQSAPYFHDGRAATLGEVFTLPGAHQIVSTVPPEDLEALTSYLLSLPAE